MKVRNTGEDSGKVEVPMTPMIDIVFQLLVFFIMTFKVVEVEGDFNIKMPLRGAPDSASVDPVPPMRLRLRADGTGALVSCSLNQDSIPLGSNEKTRFLALNQKIIGIMGDDAGPGSVRETAEVEIDADYRLHYQHVIEAVTAVSGYVDPSTGDIVKLVEKIKFSPPKSAPGG